MYNVYTLSISASSIPDKSNSPSLVLSSDLSTKTINNTCYSYSKNELVVVLYSRYNKVIYHKTFWSGPEFLAF